VALRLIFFSMHSIKMRFPREMVAQDGRCKTFDSKADGFGRAEGCGVLVLKRYTDAHKDKDRILGLTRGSAVVQEELGCSIGMPEVDGEALAMTLVLRGELNLEMWNIWKLMELELPREIHGKWLQLLKLMERGEGRNRWLLGL